MTRIGRAKLIDGKSLISPSILSLAMLHSKMALPEIPSSIFLRIRNTKANSRGDKSMKRCLPVIPLLFLLGCETGPEGNSNVAFSLSQCQQKGSGKAAAAPDTLVPGKILFKSADSLSFIINTILNCEAQYTMRASVVSAETLDVEIADTGSMRAKCVCKKDVTIGYKSEGSSLTAIRYARLDGQIFELE